MKILKYFFIFGNDEDHQERYYASQNGEYRQRIPKPRRQLQPGGRRLAVGQVSEGLREAAAELSHRDGQRGLAGYHPGNVTKRLRQGHAVFKEGQYEDDPRIEAAPPVNPVIARKDEEQEAAHPEAIPFFPGAVLQVGPQGRLDRRLRCRRRLEQVDKLFLPAISIVGEGEQFPAPDH